MPVKDDPKYVFIITGVLDDTPGRIYFTGRLLNVPVKEDFLAASNTPENRAIIKENAIIRARLSENWFQPLEGLEACRELYDIEPYRSAKILPMPRRPGK